MNKHTLKMLLRQLALHESTVAMLSGRILNKERELKEIRNEPNEDGTKILSWENDIISMDTQRTEYLQVVEGLNALTLKSDKLTFVKGDKISFKGQHSHFIGYFLNYIYKLEWLDAEGNVHPESISCNVQQRNTGTVFVKPFPSKDNKEW